MSVKDSQILRECPFCGGEAEMGINKESTVREYFVGCMNCHIRLYKIGYKRFYTEAEAIAAWNSRAERTCKQSRLFNLVWSECSSERYEWHDNELPSYCPSCGCKAVGE